MKPTVKDPNTVGIRELKQRLSYFVDLAERGSAIHITRRGRSTVTMVREPTSDSESSELIEAVRRAGYRWSGRKFVLPTPIKIKGGPISDTVLEDRR
jgi:antitoxin (DNA-binding transcriptional repressor) of toxin-antitoxin stability system